jgi:hypothetical protein
VNSDQQKSKLKTLCLAHEHKQDKTSPAQLLTRTASLKKQASQTKEGGNKNDQDIGDSNRNHNALKKPNRSCDGSQ